MDCSCDRSMKFVPRLIAAVLLGSLSLGTVACIEVNRQRAHSVSRPTSGPTNSAEGTAESPAIGQATSPSPSPTPLPPSTPVPALADQIAALESAVPSGKFVIVEGFADCDSNYFSLECRPRALDRIQVADGAAALTALSSVPKAGLDATTAQDAAKGTVLASTTQPNTKSSKAYVLVIERDKFVRQAFQDFFYFEPDGKDLGVEDELILYLGQELFARPDRLMPLYDGDDGIVRGHFDFLIDRDGGVKRVSVHLQPDEIAREAAIRCSLL